MRILFSLIFAISLGLNTLPAQAAEHGMMGEAKMKADQDAGICPVLHGPASKEYTFAYEGKTYYFCCPMCIDEFKKDPQKYISRIKEIKLEAFRYGYSPDPIVVKKGDIVSLDITSRDVTHGVYIKEYGIDVTVSKGEHKKIDFFADKAGKFDIDCSVYCGTGHSGMEGKLIVEE